MSSNKEMPRQNSSPPGNCKFAIPKKGRLYEKVVGMLTGAGIEFRRKDRLDVALCVGLPITLVFLPAADIAKFVGEGNVDMGITGFDVVTESGVTVDHIMDLGFGKCKLCVQAPVVDDIHDVNTLAGGRIVTSFPEITKEFFKKIDAEKGTTTSVKFVGGSVEAACGLGLADAVVDLVETGTTMRAAGLEVVHEILSTQAILISNPNSTHKGMVEKLKRRIEGYITATKYSMIMYNVAVDLLSEAVKVTPGKRSPTITNLEDENFKAVSSLVLKKEVSAKMDALQEVGAIDILVIDLANTRL
uniref:ATP phosphoribosyltransferase n=1 Tax=Craspedostauros australis TaxID=1486917 RepID=A0A7S0F4S4_9STRA|mmetsp:Transcript_6035/g.16430  ORF Transcript_6035/g.16430 Transcript_6035/m.16430 type:complete len:302 (+) Transcript_6035:77-982(+)|eukprot:CAMPEP_0198113348 /NCGR_PEP_ID=MMETSP1442-20131203/5041_1 /TAXON_ID= /ORGANISM="Craspedostauros australis, Strain CCMP3328" /LENGTH=301 /DNA_ID=CAMNT_0043770413 /DNA_START=29 /DNA_END=934 /DNA_ORIENTATION=+